jgi:hypothetical protein
MKLYEITQEYKNALDEICDSETGEINENALAKIDEISAEFKDKGIAVASYLKTLEAESSAIDKAREEMAKREYGLDRQVDFLKNYLLQNMERCDIKEISCPYFSIKIKKCPVSVEVLDDALIPDSFKNSKTITSLDKLKIKNAILSGEEIPGAQLKQNIKLSIN